MAEAAPKNSEGPHSTLRGLRASTQELIIQDKSYEVTPDEPSQNQSFNIKNYVKKISLVYTWYANNIGLMSPARRKHFV